MSGYCHEAPAILSVAALIAYFEEHGKPTTDALSTALVNVGRNNMPDLLYTLNERRLLTKPAARRCATLAWSSCEHPDAACMGDIEWPETVEWWEQLFWWVGYTIDGYKSDPPSQPLKLFRGACRQFRDGMSWTDQIETARWFADRTTRLHPGSPGAVWTSTFRPDQLLAYVNESSRGESEYVVVVDYDQVIEEA
jgi:hypothetical protein